MCDKGKFIIGSGESGESDVLLPSSPENSDDEDQYGAGYQEYQAEYQEYQNPFCHHFGDAYSQFNETNRNWGKQEEYEDFFLMITFILLMFVKETSPIKILDITLHNLTPLHKNKNGKLMMRSMVTHQILDL